VPQPPTANDSTDNPPTGLTYKEAGVDIEAGAELIRRIGPAAKATRRPELLGGLGGFAAMAEMPAGYTQPVLVTGAEAFLFLDYYATGRLDVDVAERVIKGIAAGCELAGCALAGGETAEMPGFYSEGEYDLAGFCVGVVEKAKIIDGSKISTGDHIIGLPSSGPHSNGYSLIRKVIERQGMVPNDDLLDDLLAPTRIYVKSVRHLLEHVDVHGMVHITGGGFFENIPRVFSNPDHGALLDLDSWQQPEVFSWLQQAGNISSDEMMSTFNCGLGMLLLVAEGDVAQTLQTLKEQGEEPVLVGQVVEGDVAVAKGQLLVS
jgi:phosphoribosylformylglycinamidine cyclo-ligase